MPARSRTAAAGGALALTLAFGEDDLRVEQAARRAIAEAFPQGIPEMGVEVIEGRASNQSEGLKILDRLSEALSTFSFFSRQKAVWLRNTNLFADARETRAQALQERVGELVEGLRQRGLPEGVSLVVSADSVDARRVFYKLAEKQGRIVSFRGEDAAETERATREFIAETLAGLEVAADEQAVEQVLLRTGGEFRQIRNELEKLAAYAGRGGRIGPEEVEALVGARPGADVWDLTGAFDRRDVGRMIRTLDQLAYQQEAAFSVLYLMISHVRQLLFLRELVDLGAIKPASHAGQFAQQITRIPAAIREQLPQEKKWNPLLGNPYALFHRMTGVSNYSGAELRRAMETLLECNEQLVSTKEDYYWLEHALLKIIASKEMSRRGTAAGRPSR